jgi:hypothetical protein
MPKMQVYLPESLYRQVKARSDELNVSNILQHALREALARLKRQDALGEVVREYEAEYGKFSAAELEAQEAADRLSARRARARSRRKRRKAA